MSHHSKRDERPASQSPAAPRWRGLDLLQLVYQLNERVFTLLKEDSAQSELWLALDEAAVRRAAAFPFLIVDVRFVDEVWWRASLTSTENSMSESSSVWPAEVARQLMSEVLVFAWHTVKWDRRVARLVLGMLPAVMEPIAALTPQQLDAIARRSAGAMRLRWEENRKFWSRLVDGARRNDEQLLAELHLHGELLLSGQLIHTEHNPSPDALMLRK